MHNSGVIQVMRQEKLLISMRRWKEDFEWIGRLMGGEILKGKAWV